MYLTGGGTVGSGSEIAQLEKAFQICGGKFGVALFVILGSYYMQISKSCIFTRAFNIWGHTFAISLISNIILISFGYTEKYVDLIKDLFPILHSNYWFVSIYFALILLSPFLNYFFEGLSQNRFKLLIMTESLFFCIIPTVSMGKDHYLNEMTWFIYLYLLVFYYRKFIKVKWNITKSIRVIIFLTSVSAYGLMTILILLKGDSFTWIRSSGSILLLISSFSIFILFDSINYNHNRMINFLASGTFVAYLVHDGALRDLIWGNLFCVKLWIDSDYVIVLSSFVAIMIIVACSLLEIATNRIVKASQKTMLISKLNRYIGELYEESA